MQPSVIEPNHSIQVRQIVPESFTCNSSTYLNSDPPQKCIDAINALPRGSLFLGPQYGNIFCNPTCQDSFFSFLNNSSKCGSLGPQAAAYYRSLCVGNEFGVRCNEILTELSAVETALLCTQVVVTNPNDCPISPCSNELQRLRDTYGCCVNTVYNNSVFFEILPEIQRNIAMVIVSYRFWVQCGVVPPPACSELDGGFTTVGTGTNSAILLTLSLEMLALNLSFSLVMLIGIDRFIPLKKILAWVI